MVIQIGVIGAGKCSPQEARIAEVIGIGIAARKAVLVCGGLGGVMEAAARGAKKGKRHHGWNPAPPIAKRMPIPILT